MKSWYPRQNRRLAWLVAVALAGATAGCAEDGKRPAREQYNQALAMYEAGEWQEAADAFLEARRSAGQDPELRFRAAFNLGLALARQADAVESSEPQQAMQRLRESAAWFRDAVSLRPDDDQARVNLEVVLRRIQVLADQLNKGKNRLEARLDRVIEDQRVLRDRIRQLMAEVTGSGSEAEPVAFQGEFDGLATFQRTLLADVGTISDLAGEELGLLQSKDEAEDAELSDEERVRMVQLEALDFYLQVARGDLADTRRLLRRLQGDSAHRRADAGLHNLKRAREQLLDPVTVLKGVAQDQTMLRMHTGGLQKIESGAIELGGEDGAEPAEAPAWLTAEHLKDRQDGAEQRTAEVLSRFEAAAAASAQQEQGQDAQGQQGQDPRQARTLEAAKEAIPYLQQATSAMSEASSALASSQLAVAADKQNQALEALFAAIERFSGIRDLIELAYRDQGEVVALLTPPGDDPGDGAQEDSPATPPLPEHLAELDTEERAARIRDAVAANIDRLTRLQGLFEDELAALDAKAAQAAQAQGGQGQGGSAGGQAHPQDDQAAQQIEMARQKYERAEELRQQALDAVERLSAAVDAATSGQGQAGEALGIAREGMTRIEELRRLFYSIIEHLKELLRNQTETHDSTASVTSVVDPGEIVNKLGPLVDAQRGHAAMGEPLASALAEQADQAATSEDAQESAERLAQAAEEVRDATAEMSGAANFLAEDLEAAASMSPDLSAALDAQKQAMEHLEEAIRLLQPPQQQNQQNQQQQQQQQQQEVSQQQAQRRLQEIRDREAERMRKKRRRQRHKPEPVEKDW